MTNYELGFLTKCASAKVPKNIAVAFLKHAQQVAATNAPAATNFVPKTLPAAYNELPGDMPSPMYPDEKPPTGGVYPPNAMPEKLPEAPKYVPKPKPAYDPVKDPNVNRFVRGIIRAGRFLKGGKRSAGGK